MENGGRSMPAKKKTAEAMPSAERRSTRTATRPTWEIAHLFPHQGEWTEEELFELEDRYGTYPIRELADGWLEVLPMPTELHQMILIYFFDLLRAFVNAHAPGTVLTSGARMRLGPKKREGSIRGPDVLYMRAEHDQRRHQKYWDGADLVMEVVSGGP